MRAFVFLMAVGASLAACAPAPEPVVAVAIPKPVQPRHPATVVVPISQETTIRPIRPDATGHFPGDWRALRRGPAYEAAHIGGGQVLVPPAGVAPAARAPSGKYTPVGKYTPGAAAIRAPATAIVATAPGGPLDCYVISQARPEPWVGKRFVCAER